MVGYIEIDKLYWELRQLYKQEHDIEKAKKIMIDSFKDILEQNENDVIAEVDELDIDEVEAKDHKIRIDEEGIWVDDVLINQEIFNEEKSDFEVRDRADQIDHLIDWASECGRDRANDKQLMKDDIEYLMGLNDEFIFSAIGTNEYIAKSDNRQAFNDICEDILKLNKDNEDEEVEDVEEVEK